MQWITRERARVDRIACPWLISRFVDPAPTFLFVPSSEVMATAERVGAIPYDVPNVELGHHGPRCSFDAFVDRYELHDPALAALAEIVRGADTDDRVLTAESAGLYAAATGFQALSRDDHENMARQFPLYDALYEFCRQRANASAPSRVVFVCLHGAAKSVVAAAHFRALAAERGLTMGAVATGTEPDAALTPAAVAGLARDGLGSVDTPRPRPVTLHDLRSAARVVSFGCDLRGADVPVERWDDVPAVGDDYEAARDAIVGRVRTLIDDLAGPTAR